MIQLGGKVPDPCSANSNQNTADPNPANTDIKTTGEIYQPVKTQPFENSRQPTAAEIKVSETKGIALAQKLDKMVSGKTEEEANKIYGEEINRLANEDFYAAFFAFLNIKAAGSHRLDRIGAYLDERNKKATKTISRYYVANVKNKRAKLAEIPYPKDVPRPGTSWNTRQANDTKSDQLAELNKQAGDLLDNVVGKWLRLGNEQLEKSEFKLAIESFSKAISASPGSDNPYAKRGFTYGIIGENQKALADLNKALEINPGNVLARSTRGTLSRTTNPNQALADFTFVISKTPNAATAYSDRGEVYTVLRQDEKAIVDFTKSISISPNTAEVYFQRGMAFSRLGKLNEAETDAEKSLRLRPGNAFGFFLRGSVLLKREKFIPAVGSLSRSIIKKPDYASAYVLRSVAYCALGSFNLAKSDEGKATSLGFVISQPCKIK